MRDVIFESDRRQSVSEADVINVIAVNKARAEQFDALSGRALDQLPVPKAGVVCSRDKKHGRMLMARDGMLTCGACDFKVAPPKE